MISKVKLTLFNMLKSCRTRVLHLIVHAYLVKLLNTGKIDSKQTKGEVLKNNKKDQNISGSISFNETCEEKENVSAPKDTSDLLQSILDTEWADENLDYLNSPIYVLELNKPFEFFYSLNRKTYVRVHNKTEVFPVVLPEAEDEELTNFFTVNNEIFDIDPKNVVYIGWN